MDDCAAAVDAQNTGCPLGGPTGASGLTCGVDDACLTCPEGCQALIDTVYSTCNCAEDVMSQASLPRYKATAEKFNCGGATGTAPTLVVVALAAAANHFLT